MDKLPGDDTQPGMQPGIAVTCQQQYPPPLVGIGIGRIGARTVICDAYNHGLLCVEA